MVNEAKVREMYEQITKALIEKKLSITTMESATGGQIASLITDTEGSSRVLRGAFVTYCNEAKIMQGVDADLIEKHSVYSKEVAESMAVSCRTKYAADIGIGVTGTMGNIDPENAEASVKGQVFFAISVRDRVDSFMYNIEPQRTRLLYKLAVAELVGDRLLAIITVR